MDGREAKYIVIRERNDVTGFREENIYPFSSHIIHKNMAVKIGGELGPNRVLGAGFIRFTEKGPVCYGRSVSLNVSSREEDSLLAKIAFGD